MRKRLLAVLCLVSLAARAQDVPRLGETVDVSIVNVDVFVTDRDGNRVHGLTKNDFDIHENGKLQPLSNFAEYTSGGDSVAFGGARQADTAPREPRHIVLFFETMQLPETQSERMFKALKETVLKIVEPGDSVSVVQWTRAGITHDEFTDDVPSIVAAIDRVAAETEKAQIPWEQIQREDARATRQFLARAAEMAATGGGKLATRGNAPPPPAAPSRPPTESVGSGDGAGIQLFMLNAYAEMKQRVAAINSAITSMSGLEGKKVLLLATRRLGEVAGAEFAFLGGAQRVNDNLRMRYGTAALMQSIVDNANASGVTIYPVNPAGLGDTLPDTTLAVEPDEADTAASQQRAEYLTMLNETVSMREIADRTGGLMTASAGQVVELLPRLSSDVTDYYSLAYRVPASGTDLARDIVVKTRKPGLTVRSRRQFVEKSDDSRMRDRLRSTLFRASQDSQIGITATAGDARATGKKRTVPVQVRVPIKDLTLLPRGDGKHAGSFSVWVASAADLDELSDVTEKTQPFEVAEDKLEAAQDGFFTYDVDVEVDQKSKYLAVGVVDEVGRTYGLTRIEL